MYSFFLSIPLLLFLHIFKIFKIFLIFRISPIFPLFHIILVFPIFPIFFLLPIFPEVLKFHLDTIPQDRSHLRGTGPSSYGTGPILFNKMGPVPNWTFSWINTILSLIWARSHGFLLIFAPTISPFSAVQLYKKQYKLLKVNFYSWNVDFRVIWDQSHHQLA